MNLRRHQAALSESLMILNVHYRRICSITCYVDFFFIILIDTEDIEKSKVVLQTPLSAVCQDLKVYKN